MRVIFLQDIPKLGKKYEVKEVANGLARNFLIPQNKARAATDGALKQLEILRTKNEKESAEKEQSFKKALEALMGKEIVIKARANEQGNLFAALDSKDIVKTIKEQEKIDIDSLLITLKKPIKKLGEYYIKIGKKGEEEELKILVEKTEEGK